MLKTNTKLNIETVAEIDHRRKLETIVIYTISAIAVLITITIMIN